LLRASRLFGVCGLFLGRNARLVPGALGGGIPIHEFDNGHRGHVAMAVSRFQNAYAAPGAILAALALAASPGTAAAEDEAATEDDADGMEVFYTFRLKPRDRPQGPRGERTRRGGGRLERRRKDVHAKPKGEDPGKENPRRDQIRPPRKDKPIDPDNPFAILQRLKRD